MAQWVFAGISAAGAVLGWIRYMPRVRGYIRKHVRVRIIVLFAVNAALDNEQVLRLLVSRNNSPGPSGTDDSSTD